MSEDKAYGRKTDIPIKTQEFKTYWVITNRDGKIYPMSLHTTKKDCIANFSVLHMLPGYKCVKVNLIFEIV